MWNWLVGWCVCIGDGVVCVRVVFSVSVLFVVWDGLGVFVICSMWVM